MRPDERPFEGPRFLREGGAAADLILAKDWSRTALGPLASWPLSLTRAVALVVRSPMAMTLLWGADGVMIYNDGYAAICGERHPAALGSPVREAWPEAVSFNDHVVHSGLAGQSLSYVDRPFTLTRNGALEQASFTVQYTPVLGDDDEPAGVLAVVVETTDKVKAEAWLRGESDRLRQMFGQAPGFTAMLRGPEHVFDLVNPAYEQIVGHRDVLGKTVREALPEIAGQGFHELLDGVYASGEAVTGTSVSVALRSTPDAPLEKRFVDFVYQPMRDPAGQVFGIFVQGFDVTGRVLAEREASAVDTRNRQILDSAVDYAIIAFDIDGNVTRWNEGAHRVLGWSEAEMAGCSAARIFTPEDRAAGRMQAEMATALSTGAGNDERWHMRKSGERFWAAGEMTPIRDDAGRASGFVKVLRDRTDQHRAAEALKESEARLRRAQEAGGVGTFGLDLGSSLMTVSAQFCRVFGVEGDETLPAASIEALVVPEDRGVSSDTTSRRDQSGSLDVEYRIRRENDGSLRWIARKAEYETDGSGRAVRMVGTVQDITDRKAAQRALDESAEQFRVFAEALPNHVWTSTPDGALDWFNSRTYEYSGMARGALDGAGWVQMVHADDLAAASALWRASLSSGDDYQTEFRLRRHDGSHRWHLARALPLRSAGGAITRWIGTNTDIHEQKLAQAASARDRNRIWALSQELMLVCDFDGLIAAVNPTATRLLGWFEHEMVGRSLLDFLHADDVADTTLEMQKLAAGVNTRGFENRYRTRDGAYRLLDWTAVPDGGFFHAVGRDITVERAAAADRERILTTTNDLMGTIGADGNLRSINPAWGRMLGFSDPALLASPLADFVAPEDRHILASVAERLSTGRKTVNAELRLCDGQGRQFLISWAFQQAGDLMYLVGRDITEQRAVEDALRQSQKMDAVGQLTGGIAHDFNNLLTIIKTSIDLMRRPNLADERRQRFMESIANAATRAAKLTGQLLAFARRQTLQPVAFSAAKNVAAVADMVTPLVGSRIGVEVIGSDDDCMVDADPGQFDTAIVNMAVNARDAMNGAGRLSIHTRRVASIPAGRGESPVAGDFVAVSLTDTGSGIDPDSIDRIFEPFFTTKAVGHGTGLGLSQVFGFARQSEGDVQVQSVVGKGTTFTLYLPLAHRPAETAGDAEIAEVGRAAVGGRILVVEDSPEVAASVEASLVELGYEVTVAGGAEEALASLAQGAERFRAVFSDVVMRGIDGIELGREIRRLHGPMPLVLSSGYSHVLASGVDPGFPLLPKPYSIDALARSLRDAIASRAVAAPGASLLENLAPRFTDDPDHARLADLEALDVLDTEAEPSYDDLTRLAALLFDAPIALISLVDSDRQWFKSRIGIDATATPRERGFCAHAIETPDHVTVVPDATKDERFASHPMVTGDPNIRFYAGAPLVTSRGHAVGTICVIGTEPHVAEPRQLAALEILARQVVERLESRRLAPRDE